MRAVIVGTGSYVPERVLTNADLERMVETSDSWIQERTGIRERRIAADGQTASDLAFRAAVSALDAAGLPAAELDLIVVATSTPDMFSPSTACLVQERLGAKRAVAFDVSAACSGFLFGLSVADQFLRDGAARTSLVIGTEVLSRIVDWTDRTTCILFGDGAGAVVLRGTDGERGILSTHLYSDGRAWDLIQVPGGGSQRPFSGEGVLTPDDALKMRGSETFKVAVRSLEDAARTALNVNGLGVEDVALLIPHQANRRIIEAVASRLALKPERVFMNLERYGNTSAASIPLALDEAVREERLNEGDIVLFGAFGGGLTWASCVARW